MLALQTLLNIILPMICFGAIQITVRRRISVVAWFSVPPLIDFVFFSLIIWQYTFSSRHRSSGVGLVGFLVSLNASLCWNLIYPTIPCLRPTALSYATGGVKASSGSRSSTRNYDVSHSFRGNYARFSEGRQMEGDEIPLRPIDSQN
ncbi:hypothetical protein LTR91_026580, partial [Friedmanniomyces endolithicus]